MDVAEIDKFQAMKARHRRGARYCFMAVVVQYGLRVLTLGLFLSSPHWLPVARCVVESFLVVSLPATYGVIMRPLPLFVVLNAIIIFLVCESKLSTSSLPQRPDLYDEYVAQSQSLQKTAASAPKDATLEQEAEEPSVELESTEKEEENEEGVERETDDDDEEEEEEEGEEEESTPAEEMDKRFEDFIARVNMQRKLEAARMLVCCG